MPAVGLVGWLDCYKMKLLRVGYHQIAAPMPVLANRAEEDLLGMAENKGAKAIPTLFL